MKKSIIAFVTLILLASCNNNTSKTNLHITGNIRGLKKGTLYIPNIKRKYLFATNFALNNRKFEVAPFIALSEIYDINIKYLDTIQKSMSPQVANSLYGKKLTQYIASIKSQK
jgi:hypothetical protein